MGWPETPPPDGPVDTAHVPDPYAFWAASTQGAYLASHSPEPCRVALRLREGHSINDLRQIAGVRIPGAYQAPMTFCSASVDAAGNEVWQALHKKACVLLAEPGLARPDAAPVRLLPVAADTARRLPPSGGGVVIGVVDGACGFAHHRLRQPRDHDGKIKSRLAAYWDQQTAAADAPGWHRPDDMGYGRELVLQGPGSLDELLDRHLGSIAQPDDLQAQASAERRIYRALGVALPGNTDWSHGTHVLDTAGGLRRTTAVVDGSGLSAVPDADVDAAQLMFVQLPEVALRDTSGRWIAALVLDGVRYIMARAPESAQVVVNLSLGSFAGPHDGSSMIESALDALVDEFKPRLTLVVAAGNAGRPTDDADGREKPCHATATLKPAGQAGSVACFDLDVDARDATESFVELWFAGAQNLASTRVDLRLLAPDNKPALLAAPGCIASRTEGGIALAQLLNLSNTDQPGPRGRSPMALVSIGTTVNVAGYRAPTGIWRIEVTNREAAPVVVDAWVERRDTPGELAGERPQYALRGGTADSETAANTLGSLANGRASIVVTGADFSSAEGPHLYPWASRPADRATGRPRLRAAADVAAIGQFEAAGFLTGSNKSLAGTSMSAAWVTRRIAAHLLTASGEPLSAAALRQWLREGAPITAGPNSKVPVRPSYVAIPPPPKPSP